MTQLKKLEFPSFRQLLIPVLCTVFLLCLRSFLLEGPLTEELLSRTTLLTLALSVTVGFLVLGCLYSYLFKARIHSYLCAVAILIGVGIAYQFFFSDFSKFVIILFLSLAAGIAAYLLYRRIGVLSNLLFWLCAGAIVVLLATNILFGKDGEYGSRLWLQLGSLGLQPSELIKVLLIVLGASSFRNPLRCSVYCALSLLCCAAFLLLRDLGCVAVLFSLFVLMTYLLFDNKLLAVGIIGAAVMALILALKHLPYAATRFANWGNALSNPDSYQQRNYIIGILMGGFQGLGTEHHSIFTHAFAAKNDGALAGVIAVFGFPVALITFGAYAALAAQAAFNKSVHTASFLIHAQLGLYIFVHALLNLLGAADLLPYTGLCAPLVSSGGTATLCFCILLGIGAAALNPLLKPYNKQ